MATLTAATVINQCRILTATPAQSQGRWSDTSILSLVDMAQKHLVQETLFPESRLTGTAVSNLQYYPIPDSHRVYRVWVNGQICTRTDGSIETWQGMQIGFNDQTGQGAPVGCHWPFVSRSKSWAVPSKEVASGARQTTI